MNKKLVIVIKVEKELYQNMFTHHNSFIFKRPFDFFSYS